MFGKTTDKVKPAPAPAPAASGGAQAPAHRVSYGVTGHSTPVTNRAMALLNVRSVKN